MRVSNRVLSLLAVGMVGLSTQAHAQGATFSTTGFSSGGTCTTPTGTTESCTWNSAPSGDGSYTLLFTGTSYVNTLGQINFGTFDLTGTGTASNFSLPAGQLFTLIVTQTNPSAGSQPITGSFTGTLSTTAATQFKQSSLVFTPSVSSFAIGTAVYTFDGDKNLPGTAYNVPFQGSNHSTTLNATVTTTPEPGSIALFATGLAGLIPVVVRRRKNAK